MMNPETESQLSLQKNSSGKRRIQIYRRTYDLPVLGGDKLDQLQDAIKIGSQALQRGYVVKKVRKEVMVEQKGGFLGMSKKSVPKIVEETLRQELTFEQRFQQLDSLVKNYDAVIASLTEHQEDYQEFFVQLAEEEARLKAEEQRQVQEAQAKVEQPEGDVKVQQQKIELRSAKDIDYRELEQLLKNQEWRKADELTAQLMCQVAGREKGGWLREEDIQKFPCEDLQTIDQLWVHYSNSKFGFSIQKKLWLECGGEIWKYNYQVWKKFAAKVGWYHPQKNDWRTYPEFMSDTQNSQKALPASLPWVIGRRRAVYFSSLVLRLADCSR